MSYDNDTIGDLLSIRFEGNFLADAAKFDRFKYFERRPDVSRADKLKAANYESVKGFGEKPYPAEEYFKYLDEEGL